MKRLLLACLAASSVSFGGVAAAQSPGDGAALVAEMQAMVADVDDARQAATSNDDDATLYECLTQAFINMSSYLLVGEEQLGPLNSGDQAAAEGAMDLIQTAHSRVFALSVEASQCESGVASFTGEQERTPTVSSRITTRDTTQTGDLSSSVSGTASDDRDQRGTPFN